MPNETDEQPLKKAAIAGVVLVVVSGIAAFVWIGTRSEDESQRAEKSLDNPPAWADASASGVASEDRERKTRGTPATEEQARRNVRRSPGESAENVGGVPDLKEKNRAVPTVVPQRPVPDRPGESRRSREGASQAGPSKHRGSTDVGAKASATYLDPVNNRVLGPRRWMAELPEEQKKSIERDLERDVGSQYPISMEDRRAAIQKVDEVARKCFRDFFGAHPDVTGGQVIVEFELVVYKSVAEPNDVRVEDPVDVRNPDFLACVRDGVASISLQAARDGTLDIQHPIFFGSRRPSQ